MLSLLVCSKEHWGYWLQLKKGSMVRAKNQQLLQAFKFDHSCVTNVWDGLKIWEVTMQVSHLISDIFLQRQCILTGTSSCRADLVLSAQRYKPTASSPVTLIHEQHTLPKSWHPLLTVLAATRNIIDHKPRRKVRWPCYIRRFFFCFV